MCEVGRTSSAGWSFFYHLKVFAVLDGWPWKQDVGYLRQSVKFVPSSDKVEVIEPDPVSKAQRKGFLDLELEVFFLNVMC